METDPQAADPRLRGRTYSIPFEEVWRTSLRIVDDNQRWTVVEHDDTAGVIRVEARVRLLGHVDDVAIRVSLDANAQTRVDARSASRAGRKDWGRNTRRLVGFFEQLDERLADSPRQDVARSGAP